MLNSHILCMHENQLSENEFCFTAFCNSCHFLPKKVSQEREKEVQEFHTNDLLTDPEIKCTSSDKFWWNGPRGYKVSEGGG